MKPKINSAWCATSTILKNEFSFYQIKEIIGLAGFDTTKISHLVQKSGSSASKGQLITSIEQEMSNYGKNKRIHFLNILVEEILERRSDLIEQLEIYLSRLGWQVQDSAVIPIDILDLSDLPQLHKKSRTDLVKAAKRFRDGDLSGALSSACSAVDNVTIHLYKKHSLGDVGKTSFQERCKVALKKTGVFKDLDSQLKNLNWVDSATVPFNKNLEGALNQGAFVMQTLRANMSDVHGTKKVFKPLVFDSIKWAEILIRVLSK
jgi:hypothetical protein